MWCNTCGGPMDAILVDDQVDLGTAVGDVEQLGVRDQADHSEWECSRCRTAVAIDAGRPVLAVTA